MGVIGIVMVIEVMSIDEISGGYTVRRKGLGLSFEKHQYFRLEEIKNTMTEREHFK